MKIFITHVAIVAMGFEVLLCFLDNIENNCKYKESLSRLYLVTSTL